MRENKSEQIQFRMTTKQRERLKKAADRRGLFESALARNIVNNWLLRNK